MAKTQTADETLKRVKKISRGRILGSVALAAFGIILLVFSNQAVEVAVRVLGALFVIGGVSMIISFLVDHSGFKSVGSIVGGVIFLILGAYIFAKPGTLVALFGLIAGILFVINGIDSIVQSIRMAKSHYHYWFVSLILGIIETAIGAACIFEPFGLSNVIVMFVGIVMIINAIFNIVVTTMLTKAAKIVHEEATAMDADGVIIEETVVTSTTAPVEKAAETAAPAPETAAAPAAEPAPETAAAPAAEPAADTTAAGTAPADANKE